MQQSLSDQAASNLDYIRGVIRRSRTVTSLSGYGLLAMGGIGIAASAIASGLWERPDSRPDLMVWQGAAGIAALVGIISVGIRARQRSEPFWTDAGRRFSLCLAPTLASGGALSLALIDTEAAVRVPAIWLLSYGSGVLAAATYASPLLLWLGCLFLGAGLAALAEPSLNALCLLSAFGIGHALFGLLLVRGERRQ